jgi:hypothetical protein
LIGKLAYYEFFGGWGNAGDQTQGIVHARHTSSGTFKSGIKITYNCVIFYIFLIKYLRLTSLGTGYMTENKTQGLFSEGLYTSRGDRK